MNLPGSYLYHDHAMSFAAASATGPIIVDPAKKDMPYAYDDERIIFLSDLFHKSDANIEKGLTGFPFEFSGEARNILINGKGYGIETRSIPGVDEKDLNPKPSKDSCEIEVLRVTAGKSYRLRFISGTAMTIVTFAMKHDAKTSPQKPLQVIEADGEYTQPYHTDRITIASGQRYSALLPASTLEEYRAEGGFWLEGREVNRKGDRGPVSIWIEVEDPKNGNHHKSVPMNGFKRDTNANKVTTEADKARQPGEEPPTEYESFSGIKFEEDVLEDMPLKPRDSYDIPSSEEVTATITLKGRDISKMKEDHMGYPQHEVHWAVGEKPYYGPPGGAPPRLVAMATDQKKYCPNPDAYDPLTHPNHYDTENNIYAVKKGAVLDIILLNMPPPNTPSWGGAFGASDSHPFHLHGAHYYDLGYGEGGYDKCVVEDNIANNRVLKRDTSMLYYHANAPTADSPDGWRAMRIKVESLGVWLFHCHSMSKPFLLVSFLLGSAIFLEK